MNGVIFDPERSIWLLVVESVVSGLFASQGAAIVAMQDEAGKAGVDL